jgi:hypothetical protein
MAKFKVGDRVKCIRAVANNKYVIDKIGTIVEVDITNKFGVEFDEYVHGHFCSLGSNRIHKGGHCWWCKESDLVKVVCSEKIVITTDGKTTTAKMYDGKEVVKTAIAKCSPEDEFDFERGALIAFSRLVNCDYRLANDTNSFDWDAFKNDEFFVQVTADNYESFVKEAEKHGCFFKNHENPNPFKDEKLMFSLRITSKYFVKPGDFFATLDTVLIGYKDNVLKFTAHAVDNKPVYTW